MSLIHWNGVSAVGRRQFASFLGNPMGYVFILAFVLVAGAVMFWLDSGSTSYFVRNIADLGPWLRNDVMGWMLCVLLPALGMGAWATERDHGTEEHLLTLPLSPFDALLGKWSAMAVFFTLALLCTLAHVFMVARLGSPDWGLVASNYLGWWLAGLTFSAIALLASTLVSLPAIAFVIGALLCAGTQWSLNHWEWYDGFNRGVISAGAIVVAFTIIAGVLGLAVFAISSRRWRPDHGATVAGQVMSLACALLLVVNLAILASRHYLVRDITSEGLSSISQASLDSLKDLKNPVTITSFISPDLPPSVALKGREVEDKLKALERASGGMIKLVAKRPKDGLDEDGQTAKREFKIETRLAEVDSVSGKRRKDIFLAAAVSCGGRTEVIANFDPGLSVEYELVRAIRAVTNAKKKVIGVATTDLEIMGSFDYRQMSNSPPWQVVTELQHQYEVHPASLDTDIAADIDVLLVPQPSTLTQAQIERLHDYIWSGRPALILEDPLPWVQLAFSGRSDLVPGQPKRNPNQNQNPYGGQPPPDGPAKGDLAPLMRALGLDYHPDEAVWSDFCPSNDMRENLPFLFTWLSSQHDSMADSDVTKGLSSALFIAPGSLGVLADKPEKLEVIPLIRPAAEVSWGVIPVAKATESNPYGGMRALQRNQIRLTPALDLGKRPVLAMEVKGTMNSAYPRLATDAAKDAKPQVGLPSAKKIHVIVIPDVDLLDNVFYAIYRDADNSRAREEKTRDLSDLKNVQLLANAVDTLMQDTSFITLRTRTQQRRSLTRIETMIGRSQEELRLKTDVIKGKLQGEIDEINNAFRKDLDDINAREDLDEFAKMELAAEKQAAGARRVQSEVAAKSIQIGQEVSRLQDEQEDQLQTYLNQERIYAIGAPSAFLAVIALLVWSLRLVREKTHIPASRRRA